MKAYSLFLWIGLLQVDAWPITIPPPRGYRVAWENLELVDSTRLDPFNSSHSRRMMVSHFYPVLSHGAGACFVPYMPPCIAVNEDNNVQGELQPGNVTWPFGNLARLQLDVGCDFRKENQSTGFPTLLFGPGFNETRLSYSAVAQQISSMGYEIIVMDHPYEADAVLFPDGQIIYGRLSDTESSNITFALEVRRKDVAFVIDHFGINTTVYIGHSFGGAAATDAQLWESNVVASVNLDGLFVGPAISEGVPGPVLALGSASHAKDAHIDASWGEFFSTMATQRPDVWAKNLNVNGSQHNSFSDYSIIADVAHLRDDKLLVETFIGDITGRRLFHILKTFIGAFLNVTLLGEAEQILSGPSKEYPEVAFYN